MERVEDEAIYSEEEGLMKAGLLRLLRLAIPPRLLLNSSLCPFILHGVFEREVDRVNGALQGLHRQHALPRKLCGRASAFSAVFA